jgi:hypothetical protein
MPGGLPVSDDFAPLALCDDDTAAVAAEEAKVLVLGEPRVPVVCAHRRQQRLDARAIGGNEGAEGHG